MRATLYLSFSRKDRVSDKPDSLTPCVLGKELLISMSEGTYVRWQSHVRALAF